MVKKMLLVGAAALPIVAGAAGTPAAQGVLDDLDIGTFSANVGIFTDYVFRGISQTNESAALQGGIDWEHDLGQFGEQTGLGLFAGVWGSNVDFDGVSSETLELDYYAGINGDIAIGNYLQLVRYQVGGIYYSYPGASSDLDLDYAEVFAGVGLDFRYWSLDGMAFFSPDYTLNSGDSFYGEGTLSVPLPYGFTLVGSGGFFAVEEESTLGLPDYVNWSAGLDFAMGTLHSNLDMFTLGFRYHDTNIDDSQCGTTISGSGQTCDERYVVSLSASIGG